MFHENCFVAGGEGARGDGLDYLESFEAYELAPIAFALAGKCAHRALTAAMRTPQPTAATGIDGLEAYLAELDRAAGVSQTPAVGWLACLELLETRGLIQSASAAVASATAFRIRGELGSTAFNQSDIESTARWAGVDPQSLTKEWEGKATRRAAERIAALRTAQQELVMGDPSHPPSVSEIKELMQMAVDASKAAVARDTFTERRLANMSLIDDLERRL